MLDLVPAVAQTSVILHECEGLCMSWRHGACQRRCMVACVPACSIISTTKVPCVVFVKVSLIAAKLQPILAHIPGLQASHLSFVCYLFLIPLQMQPVPCVIFVPRQAAEATVVSVWVVLPCCGPTLLCCGCRLRRPLRHTCIFFCCSLCCWGMQCTCTYHAVVCVYAFVQGLSQVPHR
jgi:hypothetical protein